MAMPGMYPGEEERDRQRESDHRQARLQFGQRAEFYLVALAFAVLGLSIQTAPEPTGGASDILELFGWLNLFFAGLYGLYRIRRIQPKSEWFMGYTGWAELVCLVMGIVAVGVARALPRIQAILGGVGGGGN